MTTSNPESCIILLLGKNGQVGGELQKTLAPLGKLVAIDFEDLDLSQPKEIRETVQSIAPQLIVNAAAYTAVDKAEGEPERAMAINGTAPAVLAEEAKRLGAALVHYSTDYVYDGLKKGPYSEKDEPNPLNVYGKSKLAGDQAIQSEGIPYFIFRTSWIYGLQGENFLLTVMRLAKEKEELRMIDDQIGAPTWCRFLAQSTANILTQTLIDKSPNDMSHIQMSSGLYHMTCSGNASWFKFSQAILEATKIPNPPRLVPIPTIEYPTPALRPKNSVLSNEKLKTSFGLIPPNWESALRACLQENNP
jgi:dTDP-4-dehydrorhamnose reductase